MQMRWKVYQLFGGCFGSNGPWVNGQRRLATTKLNIELDCVYQQICWHCITLSSDKHSTWSSSLAIVSKECCVLVSWLNMNDISPLLLICRWPAHDGSLSAHVMQPTPTLHLFHHTVTLDPSMPWHCFHKLNSTLQTITYYYHKNSEQQAGIIG